jgi:hypothetical protein
MMKNHVRSLTLVTAAALMLDGCAGSAVQTQPLVPQSRAATHGSWMAPDAASKNLLYVSDGSSVLVYDYGTTNQVGTLSDFSHAAGECTDAKGDVYVTNNGAADILEFAHGGNKPIRTLIDPTPYAIDCAVDPSTGNLVVINEYGQSEYSPGNVVVYAGAKGNPKTYKIKGFTTYVSGSYDASGDLLVSAYQGSSYNVELAMQPKGSDAFKAVTLQYRNQNFKYPGFVRWDGEYYVIEFEFFGSTIFEWYTIADYQGTREGYMLTEESGESGGPFWLGRIGGPKSVTRANQLAGAMLEGVMGWNYPRGGSYIFQIYDDQRAGGVSASVVR